MVIIYKKFYAINRRILNKALKPIAARWAAPAQIFVKHKVIGMQLGT